MISDQIQDVHKQTSGILTWT